MHTAIGYYNTAYHHSSWLQTTTGRPLLFDFEDHGGILPIHMVGVSATGQIPSGAMGLHYVAEVGNGRASRKPLDQEPVQNEEDDQNHKAFNLALFARPEAIHGLQTGISYYRGLLVPQNQPTMSESIIAAHAMLMRPKYEWLNEALVDRHVLLGTSPHLQHARVLQPGIEAIRVVSAVSSLPVPECVEPRAGVQRRGTAAWAVGGIAFRCQRIGGIEISIRLHLFAKPAGDKPAGAPNGIHLLIEYWFACAD